MTKKILTDGNTNVIQLGNYVFIQHKKRVVHCEPYNSFNFKGFVEVNGLDVEHFENKCKAYLLSYQEEAIYNELFNNH
jgi:hypothetical protein